MFGRSAQTQSWASSRVRSLSTDEEQWLCDNFNTLAKAPAPAESAASADAGPAPTPREQSKKTDAANKTPAAKVDTAGTESDDLELRDVGRTCTRTRVVERRISRGPRSLAGFCAVPNLYRTGKE